MFRGSPILGNFTIVYVVIKLQYPFNSAFRVSKQCHIIYDHILYVYVFIYNYAHTILQSQYKHIIHIQYIPVPICFFSFACPTKSMLCSVESEIPCSIEKIAENHSIAGDTSDTRSTALERFSKYCINLKKTKDVIHVNVWAIM